MSYLLDAETSNNLINLQQLNTNHIKNSKPFIFTVW